MPSTKKNAQSKKNKESSEDASQYFAQESKNSVHMDDSQQEQMSTKSEQSPLEVVQAQLVNGVDAVAEALQSVAENFESQSSRLFAGTVRELSDYVRTMGDKIDEADSNRWGEQFRSFAREHSKLLYSGMFLLGLGLTALRNRKAPNEISESIASDSSTEGLEQRRASNA